MLAEHSGLPVPVERDGGPLLMVMIVSSLIAVAAIGLLARRPDAGMLVVALMLLFAGIGVVVWFGFRLMADVAEPELALADPAPSE